MKETEKENTFEEALQKLERAVEKLDEGSLSLEEALSTFEDGVRWSRAVSYTHLTLPTTPYV